MTTPWLAIALLALGAPARDATPEILHHDVHVRIRPQDGILEGDCTITVSRPSGAAGSLTFTLLDGEILGVEIDGQPTKDFRYDGDAQMAKSYDTKTLVVPLPAGRPGETAIRVRYHDAHFSGAAISPEDQLPFSLGQIDAQHGSFSSHIAYYPFVQWKGKRGDIHLTVPDDLIAISSGQLVETSRPEPGWLTYHWRSEYGSGILPYPFAVHHYQRIEALAADHKTRIEIHHLPGDAAFAQQRLDVLQDIFGYYLEVFGDYPFPKLAVVETDLVQGNIGLAAQSVVMLSRQKWFGARIDAGNLTLGNAPLLVLADETAHQWNAYKVASPNFLAEGISRYTDSLYFAHRGGENVLRDHMRLTRGQYLATLRSGATDLAISNPAVTPTLYFIKGALALDLLRSMLGKDEFQEGMREYFTENAGKVTDLRAFAAAFEKVTGEELWWFFEQWYDRGGHPVLKVSWRASERSVQLAVAQQQPGPPFRLLLPVELRSADGATTRQTVSIDAAQQTVELVADFEVAAVRCDPDERLPVEISVDR